MWNKLPVKDRVDLMRSYQKGGYSYRDAVNHYNDSYQKFSNGGELEDDRISKQNKIIQEGKPTKNYSIIDKSSNTIYYYNPSGKIIAKEPVITGKSNNDIDKGLSMKKWFKETGSTNHEDYFKYLEKNKYQTTPSGIFNISGLREDTATDPNILGRMVNTFRPERAAEIYVNRIRDYGAQQKMLTFVDENGKGSSKAMHGTANPIRTKAFKNNDISGSDRNLSNGCINVNGKSICFDTLDKGSSLYILPEENKDLLYPKNYMFNHEISDIPKVNKNINNGNIKTFFPDGGEKKISNSPYQDEGSKITADQSNQQAYEQSMAQAQKEIKQDYINNYVKKGHELIVKNPVFQGVAMATPVGGAIAAIQGAANLVPDLYKGNYAAAAGDVLMTGMMGPTKEIASAINASKESGVLSNAHKLNPWAFKPNPEAYYRGIGEAGYKDAIESRVLRTNRNPNWTSSPGDSPYFFSGKNFEGIKQYEPNVIAEVINQPMRARTFSRLSGQGNESVFQPIRNTGQKFAGKDVVQKLPDIPLGENTTIYKKDWLKGYKEVEVPKELPGSPNASSLLERINLERGVKNKSNIIKENIQEGSFRISSRKTPSKGLVNVNVKSPTGSIQATRNPDGSYGLSFEDANPFNAGKSMLKLKDQLAGKTIHETKSFSTDSYANVLNLKKKLPFEEAGFVPLNSSNKANNFLDDLVTKNSKEWSASANFKSEEAAIEGAKRMDDYMLKLGETTKSKVVNNNGKFEVHVPNYKIKVPEVNTTFKKLPRSSNAFKSEID